MLSLTEQFLAWCRSKPADEEYNFLDQEGCALFQFLSDRGFPVKSVHGWGSWNDHDGHRHQTDIDPDGDILAKEPCTFGALADRLAERVERQLVEQVPQ